MDRRVERGNDARVPALSCIRANEGITGSLERSCKKSTHGKVIKMDIIDMARALGMVVILEGRIGREEYQSVSGSISALQRFAEAVGDCTVNQNDATPHRSSAANPAARLRRCFPARLPRTKHEHPAHRNALGKVADGTSAATAN
jgi:hypothetical protein